MEEGLGRNIKKAQQSQQLRGFSFHNIPAFTHQQFVDDNMLFGHPSVQEARQFKSLLTDFLEASGARINKAKSQIFFFHTPAITQASIGYILGFSVVVLPSKYIGAPMTNLALKHSSWRILLEKPKARLASWTHKTLNMASRLVLIKVVLQSMSLYLFSIMAAPKWVLKEIKHIQHSFLWGNSGQLRKWALVKWDIVCHPKCAAWFWEDSWQQQPKLKDLILPLQFPEQDVQTYDKVKLFWNPSTTQGNRKWLSTDHILRHGTEQAQQILDTKLMKRKIQHLDERDILRWGYEEKGTFTTQEAYNIIIKEHIVKDPLWNKV
eukprot:PITA_24630